jgi:hypothetical protein
MDPWSRALFKGIFLALLGAGLAWAGLILFTRSTDWRKWLAALLAIAGAAIFLGAFAAMFNSMGF